jgi:hypothetical protein
MDDLSLFWTDAYTLKVTDGIKRRWKLMRWRRWVFALSVLMRWNLKGEVNYERQRCSFIIVRWIEYIAVLLEDVKLWKPESQRMNRLGRNIEYIDK